MLTSPSQALRLFSLSLVALATLGSVGASAQNTAEESAEDRVEDGLLSDEFARDTGAIVVTANRLGRGNLFETVEIPEKSCLAKAPALGSPDPGFTIDASEMRRVRDLERIRRRIRAGTIYVSGGSFVGDDFRRADLHDMCFFGTNFSQTDWTGVEATGLGFVNVDLTGANLSRTRLPYVLFRNSKLAFVNAQGASWVQGRIDGGWDGSLTDLNLSNTDLTGFEIVCGDSALDGCPTERDGINMSGAVMRRASLHSFYVSSLNLDGAQIDQAELALDHLRFLDSARLVGPVVLRSPRRAVMLFPAEAADLAKVAKAANDASDFVEMCEFPEHAALQLVCSQPGTGPRNLLQSIQALETVGEDQTGYADRRIAWAAGRDSCLQLPDPDEQLACVIAAYEARQKELRFLAGSPDWTEAGNYRLFLSREAAFPTDQGNPGLYGRILPVLLDSAVAALIIRTDEGGQMSAKGISVEGCFFEAEALAYSVEEAALYFARYQRRRRAPIMQERLIKFEGNFAEVHDEGLLRAGTCGSQNPFPQLEELALDNELLAAIWDRF